MFAAVNRCSNACSRAGPSPAVMARLCCPGRECSKQLLQLIKAARATFEQGKAFPGPAPFDAHQQLPVAPAPSCPRARAGHRGFASARRAWC